MSDDNIARAGREVAKALIKYAKDRDDVSKQAMFRAQTDLCEAYRAEIAEPAPELPLSE